MPKRDTLEDVANRNSTKHDLVPSPPAEEKREIYVDGLNSPSLMPYQKSCRIDCLVRGALLVGTRLKGSTQHAL